MRIEPGSLEQLASALRGRVELAYKQDVQLASKAFARETQSAFFPSAEPIVNGGDTAALPWGGGYVLVAAEGMRGELIEADPWFAGFCSVLTNVNDIAASGGRPWALVDVLFMGTGPNERVFEGIAAASAAYGVPVVGGHTTRTVGSSMLAAAIVGRATRLISSHAARAGQVVLAAISLAGTFRGRGGNFNATTSLPPDALRAQISVLPALAEEGLVAAGKDVSMAGFCGTLLMLLETSKCGAVLDLGRLPAPPGVEPLRWLTAFPSFGFVLTAEPRDVATVRSRFDSVGVACEAVGEVVDSSRLDLACGPEHATYWDLGARPLTGF